MIGRPPARARVIGTAIRYPVPVHRQPAYSNACASVVLPETEKAACTVLSLPMFPELRFDEVDRVADAIRELFDR